MKKLEWAKPVLRDLGVVLTDGLLVPSDSTCGVGTTDSAFCRSGSAVKAFCYAGGTYK